MKHLELLKAYLETNGLPSNEETLEKFDQMREMLLETNKQINLTAIEDPEEVEKKHFIDSLSAASLIRDLWMEMQNADMESNVLFNFSLVDVGTGAGFPGLPLKLVFPDAFFLLLDSLAKRIRYVNQVIETLQLEKAEAASGRVEEIAAVGSVSRETFDFCVTRAVADTAVLAEYCLPLVKVGGYCILYKSGEFQTELDRAETAITTMGGKTKNIITSNLYGTDASRSLIVIQKEKATPEKYPRRPGKPSKSPIR